jgi:hypothetical protein
MDFIAISQFGGWVLANWFDIGQVIGSLVAIFIALKTRQWNRLIALAGKLAYDVALLTDLDNAQKRVLVANELYAAAGVTARKLFSKEQFELAVEMGWKLIAKPQLQAGQLQAGLSDEAANIIRQKVLGVAEDAG